MKYKNFEDFLNDKFGKLNPSVLDDDWPEAFDEWLVDLPVDDWLKYGDEYKKESIL